MGKIFGISDLPVSTIMTPFNPIILQPKVQEIKNTEKLAKKQCIMQDKFISQKFTKVRKFTDMKNGFGKLMSHFSKKR